MKLRQVYFDPINQTSFWQSISSNIGLLGLLWRGSCSGILPFHMGYGDQENKRPATSITKAQYDKLHHEFP